MSLKIKNDALFKAVKTGTIKEVINALENGANINARDEYGNTPLMYVAWRGENNILHELLKRKADVTIQNKLGWFAMMCSASAGHIVTTMILFTFAPQMIFKKNIEKHSAIDKANHNNHQTVAIILKKRLAHINV